MLRTLSWLAVGAVAGLLAGVVVGRALSGPILGSMLALAGAFVGSFGGWLVTLFWPDRRSDSQHEADYHDPPAG